jgi:hypothetical protein
LVESYTFEPETFANSFFTAAGGPYMRVVPESMMVSKPVTALVEPTFAFAPVACQKPCEESTALNSMSPEYFASFVPPRYSSEPVLAR